MTMEEEQVTVQSRQRSRSPRSTQSEDTLLHHLRRPNLELARNPLPLPFRESLDGIQERIFDFAWGNIPELKEARFPSRRLREKTSTDIPHEDRFMNMVQYASEDDDTDYGMSSRAVIECLLGTDQMLCDGNTGLVWRIRILGLYSSAFTGQPYYKVQRMDTGDLVYIPTFWLQDVRSDPEVELSDSDGAGSEEYTE